MTNKLDIKANLASVGMNLNNTIALEVGSSDIGHGKSITTHIKSNLSKLELYYAYKSGVEKCGVDLAKDVACEYEDSQIEKSHIDNLLKHELIDEETYVWFIENERYLDFDVFVSIWLKIAKLGNPLFEFQPLKDEPTIFIGGYGLF